MSSSREKLPPLEPESPDYPGHDFTWCTEADMSPGDVVLSRGQDPASDLVARLDNGIYSHSAVWTGKRIVEAIPKGVLARSLQDTLDEQAYVDIYRWKSFQEDPAGRMGDPNYPAEPVVDTALALSDRHMGYGFDELVMGAIIFGTMRRLPKDRDLRIALRVLEGFLDRILHKAFVERTGKDGMVCSQVVATSFYDAPTDHRYAIWVTLDGGLPDQGARVMAGDSRDDASAGPSRDEEDELRAAQARVRTRVERAFGPNGHQESTSAGGTGSMGSIPDLEGAASGAGPTTPAGGHMVPTGLVSIRHLQHSPSLEFVGRISARPLNQYPSIKDDLEMAIKELLEMEAGSLISKWLRRHLPRLLTPLKRLASKLGRKLRGLFGGKR